jgi:hypothetical protein
MASIPNLPAPATPVRMPTPNDPAQQAKLQQTMASQFGLTGRDATNLDQTNAGTRGASGGAYTGTWLGA